MKLYYCNMYFLIYYHCGKRFSSLSLQKRKEIDKWRLCAGNEKRCELWSTAPTSTHSAGAISRHQVTTDAIFAAVGGRRAGAGTSSMVFAIGSAVGPAGPGAPSTVDHLKRQITAWQRAENKTKQNKDKHIFLLWNNFKWSDPSKTR